MIIIPMKNGYSIGNINPTFSDKSLYKWTILALGTKVHSGPQEAPSWYNTQGLGASSARIGGGFKRRCRWKNDGRMEKHGGNAGKMMGK